MSTNLVFSDAIDPVIITARGRAALVRLRAQLDALPESKLHVINVEIAIAISRALGVAPKITEMREQIRRDCGLCDQHAIDELEERAYAFMTASADYDTAVMPPEGMAEVLQECLDARAVLLKVVDGLIAVNLLKEEQLASLKGGRGYHEAASDLTSLCEMLIGGWDRLQNRVPMTRDQIDRAQGIAEKLTQLLGVREQTPQRAAAAADMRARAFTLFDIAYEETRRAVTYLRWNDGDADTIAPSLRSRPITRAKKDDAAANAAPATAAPRTVATQSATNTHGSEPAVVPSVPTTPAPSGLPRSNPFATNG